MRMRFILNFFLVLIVFGCSKEKIDDGHKRLPRATTTGRGMFACYINNQTYIAKRQGAVNYNRETGYLFLENNNEWFRFRLFVYSGLFGVGDYQFESTGEEWVDSSFTEFYGVKEEGVNHLKVTELDLDNRIISGFFNVDLIATDGTEKFVRDGRFDLKIVLID